MKQNAKKNSVRGNAPGPVAEKSKAEKRQTAYLFSCIGGILWVVPALSSLALGILTDGMSPAFIAAIVLLLLGIPNSLHAMDAFSKRKRRPLVIAFDGVLIAGHIAVAVLLKAWYAILSPAAILLIVMIVVSDVIEKH